MKRAQSDLDDVSVAGAHKGDGVGAEGDSGCEG